jgi:hypothetical protein
MWEFALVLIVLAGVLLLARKIRNWHHRRTETKAVTNFIGNLTAFSRSTGKEPPPPVGR